MTRTERKAARAKRRADKNRVLSVHKRPVICPPDRAGRSRPFRIAGYASRALVIAAAAAGLSLFISSAMNYGVADGTVILAALLATALTALMLYHRIGTIIGGAAWAGVLAMTLLSHSPIKLWSGILCLYNGVLDRLYAVGFLFYADYKLPVPSDTPIPELLSLGMCILTALISVIFTLCLVRRSRILIPSILSTVFLTVVLTFNIYGNQTGSNLGVALMLVSFAAVLIMAAYDRLYRGKQSLRYDHDLHLFPEDESRPAVTEDENHHNAETRRRVKAYDRVTEHARAAMGGYAAVTVLVVCLVAVMIPAVLVKGNFNIIESIDEKVSFARDYVTAVLQGDESRLDELEYGANKDHFNPRPTDLEHLELSDSKLFYMETPYRSNLYLRDWIGVSYADGAWQAVDADTLAAYRTYFAVSDSPAEEMRYDLYRYMKPSLTETTDEDGRTFVPHRDYGFVTMRVNTRRLNSPSSSCAFPSHYAVSAGLYGFGTEEQSLLTYVNYFDGIYTGRAFEQNDTAYGTVAYVPIMTDETWAQNQARLQAAYNLQKEAILVKANLDRMLIISVKQDGETTRLTYRYTKDGVPYEWSTQHATKDITRTASSVTVNTAVGCMKLTTSVGYRIQDITFTNGYHDPELSHDLYTAYDSMTDEERALLLDVAMRDMRYTEFVYNTYLQPSDSDYLSSLAATILAQAHDEIKVTVTEELSPDDPDTEEYDPLVIEKQVIQNVPADVTLATLQGSASTDAYVQRDLLVQNVIDYIITEMGCEYTRTPDLSSADSTLDGTENFLRNTKEGYCVQFASAAALLLREMGIPARFVEGYISAELSRGTGEAGNTVYKDIVQEKDAHAWIEVYFDGVGWIQYETTPVYYAAMYGSDGSGSSNGSAPPSSPSTRPSEPGAIPDPDAPEEMLPSDEGMVTDEGSAAVTQNPLPTVIVAVCVAVILILSLILSRIVLGARRAEQKRRETVERILDDGFENRVDESTRRELALLAIDAVSDLLSAMSLSPRTGEFREAYAARLIDDLAAVDPKRRTKAAPLPVPDIHRVTDAVAAEEFGGGMSCDDMKELARLYLYLRGEISHRIPFAARLRLRYVKRIL